MLPNKLVKGDTIGVIAPSDFAEKKDLEYIQKSSRLFENLGIKVKLSKNIFANSLGYSATAKEKAEDINSMFEDKEVKAIFCFKGGENSNCVFDYLDYKVIMNNPKIICGFSDSTSILNAINLKTGLITFHGATFKSLTSWETDFAYKEIVKFFIEGKAELGKEEEYSVIKNGKAEGRLIRREFKLNIWFSLWKICT